MGADTEVICALGLQQYKERFYKRGVVAAQAEEMENRMTIEAEAKNSTGLVTGTINKQTRIRDGWDCDEVEEENALGGNEIRTK